MYGFPQLLSLVSRVAEKGKGMAKDDQSKKVRQVRLQVSLPEEIVKGIDDYRFATRAPNRSEAVRQLLKVGQAARSPRVQSN
jgi:Ribbon-helix-helix protein, copG family